MKEFEVGKDYILNDNSEIKFKVIKILEDRYEVTDLNTGFINYVSKGIESNYTDMETIWNNINDYFAMTSETVNNVSDIKEPKENTRYRIKSIGCEVVYKNNAYTRICNPIEEFK